MSFLWGRTRKLLTIHKRPSPIHKPQIEPPIERSSLPHLPTRMLRASMTVEAALVLPLFVFFFVNLSCVIELIRLHANVAFNLREIGDRLCLYGYVLSEGDAPSDALLSENGLGGIVLSQTFVKSELVSHLGEDYLEHAPLAKGAQSLNLLESEIPKQSDYIEINVTYEAAPFWQLAGFRSFRMANRYYGHIWNGYALSGNGETSVIVYVAENGEVYHADSDCTHLQLSISEIAAAAVAAQSNVWGEKYGACQLCCKGATTDKVYITEQGNCYHSSRDCSGLKRTVYSINLEEARKRYRRCSRCGN